jgi:hypothetical protein
MPAIVEVKLVERTCRHWVVRPAGEQRWLQEIHLAPCPTLEPARCILRSPRALAWGRNPGEAVRSLVQGIDPADWPDKVTVRLFDFSGPAAVIDDHEAESELLSPIRPSPLWEAIRNSAVERRVGLIQLVQMGKAIVPVLALQSSGARLDPLPNCSESTLSTELALSDN